MIRRNTIAGRGNEHHLILPGGHYAGLFPTDLDGIASRLDAAARLTIASHGASSDAKPSPTKAPTRTSQHQSAGT
jgi:hypothetical protein